MKSKKTIIAIVVIVAAVVVLLLYRKGVFSKKASAGEVSTPSGPDPNSLEDVIAVAFADDAYAAAFAAKARELYDKCQVQATFLTDEQNKAAQNGITLAQQVVLDASYLKCYTNENGTWTPRSGAHQVYHAKVKERILAM